MKRSFNINIGGASFSFDEDAVEFIEQFLENVKIHYENKGAELKVTETEEKIAAFLLARVGAGGIVTLSVIKSVVDDMNIKFEAADIPEANDATENNNSCNNNADASENQNAADGENASWRVAMKLGEKLFRNPNDALLGGVISGIAMRWNISSALLRVIMLLMILFFHSYASLIIIVYLLLWIATPKARNIIDFTRMRKIKTFGSDDKDVENAWKANYEAALNEMTYPKRKGCLSVGIKILFFAVMALWIIPLLFALGVLLFIFIVVMSHLLNNLILSVLIVLLFLLPIFAFVHWILKKCSVCSPINKRWKIAIIIGWLLIAVYAVTAVCHKVENFGGWDVVRQKMMENKYMEHDYWENLFNSHLTEEYHYSEWDDTVTGLPFVVDAKRNMRSDKVRVRFLAPEMVDKYGGQAEMDFYTTDIDLDLGDDEECSIFCLWDSVANEIIVDMDKIIGGSSCSINSVNPSIRYLMPSDSVNFGNAMGSGLVTMEIRVLRYAAPQLYMHGNDTIEGAEVAPTSTRSVKYSSINIGVN